MMAPASKARLESTWTSVMNMEFQKLHGATVIPEGGDGYAAARRQMIADIRAMAEQTRIRGRCGLSEQVLAVMGRVPRHRFVPAEQADSAYFNHPLPIGHGQTISQPYIVALVLELLQPDKRDVILEVGTGSGYQAAVLAEMAGEVYSMEIVPSLAARSAGLLGELGYANIRVKQGDGQRGWPEHAPFDGIVVAAAAEQVPQALVDQLKPGGRLVVPLSSWSFAQQLLLITKNLDGSIRQESILPVCFVPLTGGR